MTPLKNKRKEAIRIICAAAKDYDKLLNGNNYIFIYKNRSTNQIEFFETIFLGRKFQHLTGIEFVDKQDGTTELKLQALPLIINFLKSSKMTAIYSGIRPRLSIDRLAGTTNFCLGFTKDKDYYVPSSCLLEDIRNLADVSYQILAIFSKPAKRTSPIYKDIRYVAKGVSLSQLPYPDDLLLKISLENYIEK